MHNLLNHSNSKSFPPWKNSQFSMNTAGPYGPSGGERVNAIDSRKINFIDVGKILFDAVF